MAECTSCATLSQEITQLKNELATVKSQVEQRVSEARSKAVGLFSSQLTDAMGAAEKEKKSAKAKLAKERRIWLAIVVAVACVAIFFRFNK